MTKDYLKKYRRDYKKTEAQARVKAGLPTPKAERTRKYQEAMARKAAKAKEPKTAS
ncbi:MAG: hypothetical protein HZA91_17355 [Verrucomicrobia bacterium]|nr:hypothetical protein [Verrucomicrobiota bacterium]